jgi:prepilin-type N-terminal cleavage/methylation domain-containing protein
MRSWRLLQRSVRKSDDRSEGNSLPKDIGFSLVEVLVALALLTICLLGLAMVFPLEIRRGDSSRLSIECARLAQREFDQIRENIFAPSGTFADLDGNSLDVACSGVSGTSCGNPLTAGGDIDYSFAPPVGFSVQVSDASGQQYSIRWNITVTANDGRKLVLAARPMAAASTAVRTVQFATLVAR